MISTWANQFNAAVEVYPAQAGQTVYRLIDLFTIRDGSWEPSDVPGSVPQWARDAYLKPANDPQYNDDGGADRHLFGAVRGPDGRLTPAFPIEFWTHTDNNNRVVIHAKRHGWANNAMYAGSNFNPGRGERGPWAWKPAAVNADVVIGGGLPYNWHVSWFAVWEPTTDAGTVDPPVDPQPGDVAALRRQVLALREQVNTQGRALAGMLSTLALMETEIDRWPNN